MILTLAAYAVFMWRIQPALTLACLGVSLPLWWLAQFYSARLRPGYLLNRELTDQMVLLFSESVRGMQTVKGFAAEPHQVRRFEEANDRSRRSSGAFSGICPCSRRARRCCRS
jgi:ABC-type multidrug transport system fused ATPase/permease subunit